MTGGTRDAGMSLLELVAVMAVYAVVAILSTQLLSNAATSRARIAEAVRPVEDAVAALSVLRRDLEAAVPVAGPDGRTLVVTAGGLAFTADTSGDAGPGLTAVEWRLDTARGVLMRLTGAGAQDMIEDVRAFGVNVAGEAGFVPATAWTPRHAADLPRGFEVLIDTARPGPLRLVVAR